MKKSFESGKIWTILSAFIFMMTCGLVVFAGYTTVSSTSHFNQWSTEKLSHANNGNPILTGGDWDSIIDSLNGLVIPKGAIMAFNLDTCPNGWSPYNKANNRFLMGADNNIGTTSGRSEVTLSLNNIPQHSHYYKDTVFSEDNDHTNYINKNGDDSSSTLFFNHESIDHRYFYNGVSHSKWRMMGSNSTDYNNVPVYGVRQTSSEVCRDISIQNPTIDGNKVNGFFLPLSELNTLVNNNCVKQIESFSIQNPYVKVKYCIKD